MGVWGWVAGRLSKPLKFILTRGEQRRRERIKFNVVEPACGSGREMTMGADHESTGDPIAQDL
jgi:hypothetical protein